MQNFDSRLFCNLTLWWYSCPALSSPDVNLISFHRPHTWILFAHWFKTTLQSDFVVIIHFLHFQVQMLTWISCHRPHTRILFALWFKTTLQSDFVVTIHVLQFRCKNESLVTGHPHESLLFQFKTIHLEPKNLHSITYSTPMTAHKWGCYDTSAFLYRELFLEIYYSPAHHSFY